MSKSDPARIDPTKESKSEQIDNGSPAVEDPAVEESLDAEKEVVREGQASHVATDEARSELQRLRAELEGAKDRALRIQAELENYRKRAARQMEQERRYANLPLLLDLLPVWDNIGRAIEAAEKTHETASLLEGFKMVAGQLEAVLERHHCTRIDASDKPFDPNVHEAIFQQPSDRHAPNTVLQVTQAGFRLHDRVVRPSQVIVSAAVPETQGAAAREAAGEERQERGDGGENDAEG